MAEKTNASNILYLVSFTEGAALMAVELLGAKMIAPWYGTSLYVWTAVLAFTLGGLAMGYFFGGIVSKKYPTERALYIVVMLSAIITGLLPFLGKFVMQATLPFELKLGVSISAFILLFPPLLLFGMVSPMIINLLSPHISLAGKSAGRIYAVSTLGGILATFLAGFYLIPFVGVKESALCVASALAVWPLFFLVKKFFKKKTAHAE